MKHGARFPLILVIALACVATSMQAQDASDLRERHSALRNELTSNPFGRPLHMESSQSRKRLTGDIYAEIDQPYATAGAQLQEVNNWCDILILHLNTKSCRAFSSKSADILSLHIGRKTDQSLRSAQPIDFEYTVVANTSDYLQVQLDADEGPVGTSDYRIALEVVALDSETSFLHLSYSYSYSMAARLAMQGYLATAGRSKLGFSITGHDARGNPEYANGMRGVVERNTMRYYLAIEAYLGALATPPEQQDEKRLNDWFAGSERYPLQLHEIERDEYLDMKRDEIRRQRAPAGAL